MKESKKISFSSHVIDSTSRFEFAVWHISYYIKALIEKLNDTSIYTNRDKYAVFNVIIMGMKSYMWLIYLNLLASLSHSIRDKVSPFLTGPKTFLISCLG